MSLQRDGASPLEQQGSGLGSSTIRGLLLVCLGLHRHEESACRLEASRGFQLRLMAHHELDCELGRDRNKSRVNQWSENRLEMVHDTPIL